MDAEAAGSSARPFASSLTRQRSDSASPLPLLSACPARAVGEEVEMLTGGTSAQDDSEGVIGPRVALGEAKGLAASGDVLHM